MLFEALLKEIDSRGSPSSWWLGGGGQWAPKIMNEQFCEQTGVSYSGCFQALLIREAQVSIKRLSSKFGFTLLWVLQ